VNSVCNQSLIAAYGRRMREVPIEIVDEVASHFRLDARNSTQEATPSQAEQTEAPPSDKFSEPAPAVMDPAPEVPDPIGVFGPEQSRTTISSFSNRTQDGRWIPLHLSERPENVGQFSDVDRRVDSTPETSRIGLESETLDATRGSSEESALMADPRDELLDSFEEGFRKAWTQNETSVAENQPVSGFLMKEVGEVCSRTGAGGAFIALRDQEGLRCVASAGDAPAVGSRLQLDSHLTRDCLETGHAMICEDIEGGWGMGPSIARSLHLRSAIAVPIQTQGSSVGVIEAFSSRPSAFRATHVTELQQMADVLVTDPGVLQIVNFKAPVLDSPPVPVAPPAEGHIESERSVALPEIPPDVLRSSQYAAVEREREAAAAFHEEKKTATRAWLALVGVAAVVLFGFLFWFGSSRSSRPATVRTSSSARPAASDGARHGEEANSTVPNSTDASGLASGLASSPASGPKESDLSSDAALSSSSSKSEKKSEPRAGAFPVVQDKSPAIGESAAAVARDSKLPTASSNISVRNPEPPPAPAAEVNNLAPKPAANVGSGAESGVESKLEPGDLPVESARAALPAVSAAIPPPMAIRSVNASRPEFALDHTLKSHAGWVTGVAFSSDGRRLASGSSDQTVKTWDVSTGRELGTVGSKMKEVQAVAFSRDGRWLAAENTSDLVTLWDATTGREIQTLPSNKPRGAPGSNWVYSIAFSPDGRWLASGVDDKTVRVWDVATGRVVRDLTGMRRSVMYAAFSPDGRWLASGDDDKNIRIWDASTGEQKRLLTGHKKAIYAVVFSPDGRWLASASADKTVKLWDVAAGREAHTLTGHGDIVTSLAFSPDGRWLASGSWDKTIKIWDVETGLEVQTLTGNDHSVYSIAFDSSGHWLASGSEDGKINLWRSAAPDQARAR
jgi:WD40 repeat protein/putative methionine-R-sulfoxide reductase with GAF domain